jgi:hypothetical protein
MSYLSKLFGNVERSTFNPFLANFVKHLWILKKIDRFVKFEQIVFSYKASFITQLRILKKIDRFVKK